MRDAIRGGLLSPDTAVRKEVFEYLSEMSHRWLDLRPFVDLLEEYAEIPESLGHGRQLADDSELFGATREERLEAYKRAIRDGAITLKRGTTFPRAVAMGVVAAEGLTEASALVEQYYPQLPPELQRSMPLARLQLELSLRAGAADREDALRLAAERLSTLDDAEFAKRMDENSVFQQVVLQTADEACDVDPFRGVRNPACASMHDIATRQKELRSRRDVATQEAGAKPRETPWEGPWTWLGRLVDAARCGPIAPPDQIEEVRRTRTLPQPKKQ